MNSRKDAIDFCLTLSGVYLDYPFHDDNWSIMRHRGNKKMFAAVFKHQGNIWINLKCAPEVSSFWRSTYSSVIPAYHMNKEHWNSVILDGTVPECDIKTMIAESYELTK